MRTLFDIEEEEELETKASEITLGTASLLGIFFGLVLVCGVFFGFGYSLGRGTAWVSHASTLSDSQTAASSPAPAPTTDPIPTPAAPEQQSAKAALPPIKTETVNDDGVKDSPKQASTQGDASPNAAQATNSAPVVNHKPNPGKEVPAFVPMEDTAATPAAAASPSYAGKPMVQIAAVARPQDAYALITALRQHGYNAVMRSDGQDKLVHVQVGPFADRNQASAMRDKLLADGYNAIIKQ
jgi:DedD protein